MARPRRSAVSALSVAALLGAGIAVAGPPTVAEAGRFITGKDIKNGSVTSKDLRDNSVQGADIRDGSITSADLAADARTGTGPVGPQGARGERGPAGEPGSTGAAGPEIVTWTFDFDENGDSDVSASTADTISAGTLVQLVESRLTGDLSRCSFQAPRVLLDLAGSSLTSPKVLTRDAALRLTVRGCVGSDQDGVALPDFTYDVTLALTPIDLTPDRALLTAG